MTPLQLADEAINMSSMHFPIRKIHVIETLISAFESEREWITYSKDIWFGCTDLSHTQRYKIETRIDTKIKELSTCIQRLTETVDRKEMEKLLSIVVNQKDKEIEQLESLYDNVKTQCDQFRDKCKRLEQKIKRRTV